MRKITLAIVAIATLTAGRAIAAPPAAPTIWTWTGFYAGGNIGYGWSGAGVNLVSVGTTDPLAVPGVAEASARTTPQTNTKPRGLIGGGQFGYNYQVNQMVWGIEADFSFANISDSDTADGVTTNFISSLARITAVTEQKLNFFGTLRGRLGFTPY